ncbi:MAG: hypothetical protein JNM11_08730 [Chitinimonas sp.]|nr:hypothetical protein [Chitinimonas sp.]
MLIGIEPDHFSPSISDGFWFGDHFESTPLLLFKDSSPVPTDGFAIVEVNSSFNYVIDAFSERDAQNKRIASYLGCTTHLAYSLFVRPGKVVYAGSMRFSKTGSVLWTEITVDEAAAHSYLQRHYANLQDNLITLPMEQRKLSNMCAVR